MSANDGEAARPELAPFVVLVFLLAVPFWLLGTHGGSLLGWLVPVDLPLSALGAFVPMIAALILCFRSGGRDGALRLLASAVDVGKIGDLRWLVLAVMLMPAILGLDYALLWIAGRTPPDPVFPIAVLPAYLALFFLGAVGEELGWQAYGIAALRGRMSALRGALVIGLIWAMWHVIPFLQTSRAPAWIVWQMATTILVRIIIVWLSNNAGRSVFVAVVFHMMINVGEFMVPNYGSHYDPFLAAVIMAALVAVIIRFWGAATLADFRARG